MEEQKDRGKGEREERKGSGREEMSQWEVLESPARTRPQRGAQATSQVTVEGQITE